MHTGVHQHCNMFRLFIRLQYPAETNKQTWVAKSKWTRTVLQNFFTRCTADSLEIGVAWRQGLWTLGMGGVKDLCSRSITWGIKNSALPAQGLRYKCGQFLTTIEKWKLQPWSSETWLLQKFRTQLFSQIKIWDIKSCKILLQLLR